MEEAREKAHEQPVAISNDEPLPISVLGDYLQRSAAKDGLDLEGTKIVAANMSRLVKILSGRFDPQKLIRSAVAITKNPSGPRVLEL